MAHQTAGKRGVEVFQIETRNPHLHEDKGEQHLEEMLLPGLGVIYHSRLCGDEAKQIIRDELLQQKAKPDRELPKPLLSAPPNKIDLQKFSKVMEEPMASYSALRGQK